MATFAAARQDSLVAMRTTLPGTSGPDYRLVSNIDASGIPLALRKRSILFYCPDMEDLAKRIVAESDGMVELGGVEWA